MISVWRTPLNSPARRVPRWLYAGIAAIMVIFVFVYIVHKATERVPKALLDLLHVNSELSLPAWYNAGLLLFGAILAAAGFITARASERPGWFVLSGALAYLSLDELAAIHEQFGRVVELLPILDVGTFHWVVPGVVLAAIGTAVLVYFGRRLPAGLPGKLIVPGALYLAGALGVEALTGFLIRAHPDNFWIAHVLHTGLQVIEESMEMVACVMVIAALLAIFERDRDRLSRLTRYLGH